MNAMQIIIVRNAADPLPAIGSIVLCNKIDALGTARPARRLVKADGSPRADLISVRVVSHTTPRRLTLDAIRDGALPSHKAICEVVS